MPPAIFHCTYYLHIHGRKLVYISIKTTRTKNTVQHHFSLIQDVTVVLWVTCILGLFIAACSFNNNCILFQLHMQV